MKIEVYDGILDDFEFYKKQALSATFQTVESQGVEYKGISQDMSCSFLSKAIENQLQVKIENKLNFVRTYVDSPEYKSPGWIHADGSFSTHIAVLFIQASEYWQDDGMSFWKNKALGISQLHNPSEAATRIVNEQSTDPDKWKILKRVEFKPNRLVIAPANSFHSKSTYRNGGKDIKTARLVHVLFFDKVKK